MTKIIYLTKGFVTKVDDEDFDELSQFNWQAGVQASGTVYAVRHGGVRMHRVILNAPKGRLVDHADHDGLNNQRFNLRLTDYTGNCRNSTSRRGSSSRFLGVDRNEGSWRARIQVEKRNLFLGRFPSEAEAAQAYDEAAREHFGAFANLNFKEAV